jgi:hypothetical protein
VELDQLLHQRKPDARAFEAPASGALDPMEALEDVRQLGFRNTDSGVTDGKLDKLAGAAQPDEKLAFERELECVRQQVQDDLLPLCLVDACGLGKRLAVDD